jgi:hypothetical protein
MRVPSWTPPAWLLLSVAVSGCVDRGRLNAECAWTGDSAAPLDLTDAADAAI